MNWLAWQRGLIGLLLGVWLTALLRNHSGRGFGAGLLALWRSTLIFAQPSPDAVVDAGEYGPLQANTLD